VEAERTSCEGKKKNLLTPTGFEPVPCLPQEEANTHVAAIPSFPLAHSLARETQIDPDLARLIDAWPNLPPTVKRMILASLEASEPAK
jgi:hypothetical protein